MLLMGMLLLLVVSWKSKIQRRIIFISVRNDKSLITKNDSDKVQLKIELFIRVLIRELP